MAPPSNSSIIPLPYYILALVLAKSKPANKSMQEWLQLLGSFIKDGPRSNNKSKTMHYIDEAAMWYDAYTRSEEAQLALRARNLELEKLLEVVTGETDPLSLSSPKKRRRKAIEPSKASASRIQKKPRLVASAKAATFHNTILGDHTENNERPATASLGHPIISHLFILQQTLAQKYFEPFELAATLCQTATSICRYLKDMQLIKKTEVTMADVTGTEVIIPWGRIATQAHGKDDETMAKLFALGQIFPKLLAGLDKLLCSPGGKVLEDRVVYDYIQIFHSLLQRICRIATTRAKELLAATQGKELQSTDQGSPHARSTKTPCSTCRDRALKCDARMPKCRNCSRLKQVCRNGSPASSAHTSFRKPVNLPPVNQIMKLCELEITMLRCLDLKNQGHAKVLQGFFCILCKKVGHGLKKFVFDSEDDGLSQELDSNRASTSHDEREDDEAIEAQGPYLVWILEQTKLILSRHDSSDDPNHPLSMTRNRLQNTLLKSVFGQEASIAFEPSLQAPPAHTDADIVGLKLPPVELKNWFKHEVWRMLGWDVLRNHIQWD